MDTSEKLCDDVPPWFAKYMDNMKTVICAEVTAKVVYTVNLMMEEKFKHFEERLATLLNKEHGNSTDDSHERNQRKQRCSNAPDNRKNEVKDDEAGDATSSLHDNASHPVSNDGHSISSSNFKTCVGDGARQDFSLNSGTDELVSIPMPACFDTSVPFGKASLKDSFVYVKKRVSDTDGESSQPKPFHMGDDWDMFDKSPDLSKELKDCWQKFTEKTEEDYIVEDIRRRLDAYNEDVRSQDCSQVPTEKAEAQYILEDFRRRLNGNNEDVRSQRILSKGIQEAVKKLMELDKKGGS